MQKIILAAALLLSACSPRVIERVRVQQVNVPVPVPCPAAVDPPAKPAKPDLPDDLESALRVVVGYAARLTGWGEDVAGRLAACSQVSSDP